MTKIEKISEIIREYENGCNSEITADDIINGIKSVLDAPKKEYSDEPYIFPVHGGYLELTTSPEPTYPGIDVWYIKENEDRALTRARIVLETPEDKGLRLLVWNDPLGEDYTDEIKFENG